MISFFTEGFTSGETVTKEDQINLNEADDTLSTTQSLMSLSTAASSVLSPTTSVVAAIPIGTPLVGLEGRSINADEWEKERSALYQQLDEKVISYILIMMRLIFRMNFMLSRHETESSYFFFENSDSMRSTDPPRWVNDLHKSFPPDITIKNIIAELL